MQATYRNNLATVQGLSFEEIIANVNKNQNSLQLKISPSSDFSKDGMLGFGKNFPILLTTMKHLGNEIETSQYLVGAFDDYESAMKELKKFQRQFKKLTGFSLLKDGIDRLTDEPIWTTFIK